MQEIPIGGSDRPRRELSIVSRWPVYSSSSSGRLRRILVVGDENVVVFDLKVTGTVSKQHVEWAVSILVSQFSFRSFFHLKIDEIRCDKCVTKLLVTHLSHSDSSSE